MAQIIIKLVWRDFRLPKSEAVMVCAIGKSIFAVNLPLKLLRATTTNAETGSLKSLHKSLKVGTLPSLESE